MKWRSYGILRSSLNRDILPAVNIIIKVYLFLTTPAFTPVAYFGRVNVTLKQGIISSGLGVRNVTCC